MKVLAILPGFVAPFVSILVINAISNPGIYWDVMPTSYYYFKHLSYYLLCLAMHLLYVKINQKHFKGRPSKRLLAFAIFWWTIVLTISYPPSAYFT